MTKIIAVAGAVLVAFALTASIAMAGVSTGNPHPILIGAPPVKVVPVAIVKPPPVPAPVPVPTTTTTTVPVAPVVPSAPPVVPPAPVVPVTVPVAPSPPPVPVVKPTFLAEAQSQIGVVNPSYDGGGSFWCYLFVNYVGDNSNTPGWMDSQDPGGYVQTNAVDPSGPQPGDIALYGVASQMAQGNDYVVHVGIVESVNTSAGTFTAIEGNGLSADSVIETVRPITGVGPEGFQVYEFLLS